MKFASLLITFLLLGSSGLFAQSGKEKIKEQKIDGVVLQHKTVRLAPKGKEIKEDKEPTENLVVQVQTKKEKMVVDLGSFKKMPNINEGKTRVSAEGRIVQIGNQEFMIARKAEINGDKLAIKRPLVKKNKQKRSE